MNSELIEYYRNLLIIQYSVLAKAPDHIRALIDVIMFFDLMIEVRNAYDIDTAVGVQQDILGKYLGIDRDIPVSPYILSDTDYRFYQRLKVIQNNSNHSTKSIVELVYQIFGTDLLFFDRYNMSIAYIFPASVETLVTTAKDLGLLPKPAAVGLSVSFTVDIENIFGYQRYGMTAPTWAISYKRYGVAAQGGMKKYG